MAVLRPNLPTAASPTPSFDRECEASLATAQTHREASGRVPGSATQTVVGVGASAGGLEALTQLIGALPPKTGMSFVIVQHLAPKRASSLAAILACATKMPVSEVREEPDVEPNHVYVIPPAWDLIIVGGKLRLLPQERRALHHGIDQFFRSLASDCGHQAIGVVLSGNASDGTHGIVAIKEAGGITFAQDQSAQHDSMPRNAVASGCVDFVLPPGKIAQEIARISRRLRRKPREKPASTDLPGHAAITRIVHEATGIDFSGYKVKTLQRRIARRMALHKLRTLQTYEEHLKQVPEEAEALSQDILINVTSFFRNPEAFETLEHKVFPTLIARLAREPLRIWTIGCSSGEEAYSLAMLVAECTAAGGSPVPLQLFGTDLNNIGVAKARLGLYPKTIVEGVSPERLKRFFTEEDAGYRISKAIREQCVFSRHNVLSDPPFSRVDLISCRNLLIYLEPVLHEQIIPMLHYALKPGGFLWLGSSETITTARSLFDVANAPHKIFLRGPERPPRDRRDHLLSRGETAPSVPGTANGRRLVPGAELRRVAESILLTKYAPPGVVISAGMEIVQFRGATGSFLAPAAGAPSLHLLKMLREGLLVPVRTAVLRAAEEGRSVREEGLRIKSEGRSVELALEVIPIKSGAGEDGGFLVLFDEGARLADRAAQAARDTDAGGDELVRAQHELAATREYLQSVIEQQEVANGELQAAVEEAQSANEELQSVNEELETSKEEIQSSNEELATLNDELTHRNLERGRLNESLRLARDYAESIVASVRWPLVVLDAGLRVKTASRAFCEVFHVGSDETEGRLIYDLGNGQWNIPALRTLLEELLPRHDQINDFEVRHNFEQIGPRIMLLNARRLTEGANAENEPLIVLAIEDITTRRGQEELLAARASELLHADRSKDEFLAMLAHELRNPLAPLRNAAEILQTTTATAKQRMEAEDILRRQIENMSRMIDDLLDVARIIEGKIELRKEVVVIQTVLAAAVNVARPAIQARGQELAMSLPEEAIFLHADATRLDQIFGNLLGNACKYSERGGHISVHADRVAGEGRRPAELVVRVCDDGMGIAPELLPHVFELFVQATHALDRAQGGLGIGLTLVERLVNLHGGNVSANSAGLGHGSEFIVRLPILPSPAGVAPPASVHSARDPSRRMLIVDDNEDSARSMSTLQRLRGHETRTVFTGPDAVAAAIEFAPEVVLLDIGLPGMDGYEVARRLRAIPALDGTFLVAMTGYGTDGDRALAKEAGFDEYFVKPVDLELLRAWLRSRP